MYVSFTRLTRILRFYIRSSFFFFSFPVPHGSASPQSPLWTSRPWFGVPSTVRKSRGAQRKRAGPITQRSMDRNHPVLGRPRQLKIQSTAFVNIEIISLVHYIDEAEAEAASQQTSPSGLMDKLWPPKPGIVGSSLIWGEMKQSGAAEACWAHNPEVDGSKPSSARQAPTAENSLNCFCQTEA